VCDLLFTALAPFDAHRRSGVCTPPDKVVNKRGERLLFGRQRAGGRIVWGGPEREWKTP
jgi:hypothetical protein